MHTLCTTEQYILNTKILFPKSWETRGKTSFEQWEIVDRLFGEAILPATTTKPVTNEFGSKETDFILCSNLDRLVQARTWKDWPVINHTYDGTKHMPKN